MDNSSNWRGIRINIQDKNKKIKKECSLRGFCLVGARAIVHILGIGEIIMLLQIKHIIQVIFNAGTERSVWLWRCIVVII